jgi:cyclic pyranopterin phosphate synthase
VLRGLDCAERAGFASLKVNCVTMRHINDDEFVDFARLSVARRLTVRFIEYMPLGDAALMHLAAWAIASDASTGASRDASLSATRADARALPASGPAAGCGSQDRGDDAFIAESEVRRQIERALGPLIPVPRDAEAGVGPAVVYRLVRGSPRGRIGFISAMSAPFCATCNRLRLTADGKLHSCLFEGGQVDLRPAFASATDARELRSSLADAMTRCVRMKPTIHTNHGNQQMSRIGG